MPRTNPIPWILAIALILVAMIQASENDALQKKYIACMMSGEDSFNPEYLLPLE